MTLKTRDISGGCPMERFNVLAGAGYYDNDPVEKCSHYGFHDPQEEFLEKSCRSPFGMSVSLYNSLYKSFIDTGQEKTRSNFCGFVEENIKK